MNEQMNMQERATGLRWKLLVSVSAGALLASAYMAGETNAADADRPPLWIEFGGQFAQLDDSQQPIPLPFKPSFADGRSPIAVQKQPRFGFDEDANLTYQPEGGDWIFSGGIRFGRSVFNRHQHLQTGNKPIYIAPFTFYGFHLGSKYLYPSQHVKFADTFGAQKESHLILDFQAGKEVGLGMFGNSVLSAGVRIAQFTSKSNISVHAEPDVQYPTATVTNLAGFISVLSAHIRFHDYAQMASRANSFGGIGPKLDWKASTPLAGTPDNNLSLDWGANLSVLFGRQRMHERHQTKVETYYLTNMQFGFEKTGKTHPVVFENSSLYCGALPVHCPPTSQHTNAGAQGRSRSVIVPNLGGFAALSFRYANAKISLGYRADVFFGAIDGGIDARKEENRGFYGPFASISVGLGD